MPRSWVRFSEVSLGLLQPIVLKGLIWILACLLAPCSLRRFSPLAQSLWPRSFVSHPETDPIRNLATKNIHQNIGRVAWQKRDIEYNRQMSLKTNWLSRHTFTVDYRVQTPARILTRAWWRKEERKFPHATSKEKNNFSFFSSSCPWQTELVWYNRHVSNAPQQKDRYHAQGQANQRRIGRRWESQL